MLGFGTCCSPRWAEMGMRRAKLYIVNSRLQHRVRSKATAKTGALFSHGHGERFNYGPARIAETPILGGCRVNEASLGFCNTNFRNSSITVGLPGESKLAGMEAVGHSKLLGRVDRTRANLLPEVIRAIALRSSARSFKVLQHMPCTIGCLSDMP